MKRQPCKFGCLKIQGSREREREREKRVHGQEPVCARCTFIRDKAFATVHDFVNTSGFNIVSFLFFFSDVSISGTTQSERKRLL